MPRRALHSAEAEVDRRTAELSAALLEVEEQTFTGMAYHFGARAPHALAADNFRPHLDHALVEGFGLARALLDRSTEMAIDSIGAELEIVEETLSAADRGSALAGIATAHMARPGVLRQVTERVRVGLDPARDDAFYQANRQRQLSRSSDELAARLFSPEPVRLPGLPGRGVWYRPMTWLQHQSRTSSMWAVNALRLHAMRGMNG